MKTRLFADLVSFARAACTHASHLDREVPLLPFYVREQPVGWLRPSFADLLRRWPHHFEVTASFATLRATPDTVHGRTAAMAEVTAALEREGVIRGWRDEMVSVTNHYAAPELLRIERAATRHFGMMAYGAHLNGFTRRRGEPFLWIARRAASKSVDPDRLDNLVGGRIACGYTVDETIRKEAWEEAGIPPALLKGLACAGAVRVEYSVPEGLHREVIFTHDLWLPEDFRPQNQDGEVARLYCLSIPETIEAILAGEFTLDAGAVTVDALLRNAVLAPEDPLYLDLLRLLRA
jgi:8-oxo-dGTP pyrophosphatase MutT (NUDIX family)